MDPSPGNKNLITDITGIQVGHAEDYKIGTGVTVITGDKPCATERTKIFLLSISNYL